ncbi:MAG: hypothetical protein IJC53_03825 [Clostridia bacterium]|nr:hypothetical protein [Clostridia bacterium]
MNVELSSQNRYAAFSHIGRDIEKARLILLENQTGFVRTHLRQTKIGLNNK